MEVRVLFYRSDHEPCDRRSPRAAYNPGHITMAGRKNNKKGTREPTIENRRARHDYTITDTLECGMKLAGTEVKAIRQWSGQSW